MRAVRALIWLAGAALCAAMARDAARGDYLPPGKAAVHYGLVLLMITIGLLVWERRPDSRTGILLTAAPFAYALGDLGIVFRHSSLAWTVGLGVNWFIGAIFAHLFLTYPTGRFSSRLDRAFVAFGYVFALIYALPFLLFFDPRYTLVFGVRIECPACGAQPLTNIGWHDLTTMKQVLDRIAFVLILAFLVLLVRKLVRATPGARRVVLPLLAAGFFLGARAVVSLAFQFTGATGNFWTSSAWFWSETIAMLGVPLALAAGLLWGRTARSAVADLVVELERTPPGAVRDALARALGDPSLEVALWLPEQGIYVNRRGDRFELPAAGSERAVTRLGPADAPIAALVHDPMLLERRALLEAAGAAARLALENERLQAELRRQLEEVRASRSRIVQAGDDERRRLERNLHDGAQQRLLGLGLALQLARAELGPEANGAAELLEEAEDELRAALDELRELARGIHPAILTDQGLAAALRSLAERSPVPVTIRAVPEERLSEPIEVAAYFLVSESLANVSKYAHASGVAVRVGVNDGLVVVEVEDDGVGSADARRGSGLRGLSDRVHALDGELEIDSPPGGGTRIHAEIPCGS